MREINASGAIRYLSKNSDSLGIDPTRVGSMVDPAGGQMSQMLPLSSPESLPGDPTLAGVSYEMVAGVSWYGSCDFENEQLFNTNDSPTSRDHFGGSKYPLSPDI
jgi:acetyl esterase/lipase